jgi:hypothetical protein
MDTARLLAPFDTVFAEQKGIAAEEFNNDELYKLKLNEVRGLKMLAWACCYISIGLDLPFLQRNANKIT